MKIRSILTLLSATTLLLGVVLAQEAKPPTGPQPPARVSFNVTRVATTEKEKEKVTYLGIETAPVPRALAAHLGLPPEHGLTVQAVAENSPAVGVLQQHDVLRKFDDQLLVDSRQLSVLIRARKPGDEVRLTIVRAGKEQVITARLGEREVESRGDVLRRVLGDGNGQLQFRLPEELRDLPNLPGIDRADIDNVIRMIGQDRGQWFGSPRVHFIRRGERGGSTVLNIAEGSFVFSDSDGVVEVNASKGERHLSVKDAKGTVLFDGPIYTDDQRENLPPAVKERLRKIDASTIEFESTEGLEHQGAALPSGRTKTSRTIRSVVVPAAPVRTF
jgi:serine protease Do